MKLYSIYYNHNRLNLNMRRRLKSSYSKKGAFNEGGIYSNSLSDCALVVWGRVSR